MRESGVGGPEPPDHRARRDVGALLRLYRDAARLIRGSRHLRRSLLAWLAGGLTLCVGLSAIAGALVSPATALVAGAIGLGWWAVIGLVLCGGPPLLVTPEGRHLDFVGWPNGLSALRAWSCAPLMLIASLSIGETLSLGLWCGLGVPFGLLDLVDGWIARRFGPITQLGKAIDPAGDAVFFALAAVGNALLRIIPVWLGALLILRYFGPLLVTPLVFLSGRRPELVHTVWGRRNTGLTGIVLLTCMFTRLAGGPVSLVALLLGVPLLGVTTLLHFGGLWRRVAEAPVVTDGPQSGRAHA